MAARIEVNRHVDTAVVFAIHPHIAFKPLAYDADGTTGRGFDKGTQLLAAKRRRLAGAQGFHDSGEHCLLLSHVPTARGPWVKIDLPHGS
jgi:hypothetical protein